MDRTDFPFELKPLVSAAVSEISEITAAAAIDPGDKINFHIGNPLQDERLSGAYADLCLGESEVKADVRSFIREAVKKSVVYSPRGGYRSSLPELIKRLRHWLEQEQRDSLFYNFGDQEGIRESVLCSGGLRETLRVILDTFSRYSLNMPVRCLNAGAPICESLPPFKGLQPFSAIDDLEELQRFQEEATILVLGALSSAAKRRWLRRYHHKAPLVILEVNNAANASSLARESGTSWQVIRILDMNAIAPGIKEKSLQFVLGHGGFLQRLEAHHFELKGTPSSSELAWMEWRLRTANDTHESKENMGVHEPNIVAGREILRSAQRVAKRFSATGARLLEDNPASSLKLRTYSPEFAGTARHTAMQRTAYDPYSHLDAEELLHILKEESPADLEDAFLGHFCRHHPAYNSVDCYAVSGSARSAFSLLGRHGRIKKVLVTDLSWSYENAFEAVEAIAPQEDDDAWAQSLCEAAEKLAADEALVLNNPHNASGRVFGNKAIEKIVLFCLQRKITVIDDLCYPNVAPMEKWPAIKSVKQIALEAARNGLLPEERLRYLVTIHSLSKSDCFAGARLAVAEMAHPLLAASFCEQLKHIAANTLALYLAYLFYRNTSGDVQAYWQLRNTLLQEKAQALQKALIEIPAERNSHKLNVVLPAATLYPHLEVGRFDAGLSLEKLAVRLAENGIGLVPLSNFARTTHGFTFARNRFRLTLGGSDSAAETEAKARRLYIELNRALNSEAGNYHLYLRDEKNREEAAAPPKIWDDLEIRVKQHIDNLPDKRLKSLKISISRDELKRFAGQRLAIIRRHVRETWALYREQAASFQNATEAGLKLFFESEFYKQDIAARRTQFIDRLFDRTVHPTQMYALEVDLLVRQWLLKRLFNAGDDIQWEKKLSRALLNEYAGSNIALNSEQEAAELVYDLWALTLNDMREHGLGSSRPSLLSFWGDWDGSTRPSGQGHRLVAAVLIENLQQMSAILKTVNEEIPGTVNTALIDEVKKLPSRLDEFWKTLNKITRLTQQLEERYSGLMPAHLLGLPQGHLVKRWRDPLKKQFAHNDRLERRMLQLRKKRREQLDTLFNLNKRLRKTIFGLSAKIISQRSNPRIALALSSYRNLLTRFALTPRIHQKMARAADPFAIETTIQNLLEINRIGAGYGNPLMIPALQISMSSEPQTIIRLDRLMRSRLGPRDSALRFVPLFEEEKVLVELEQYLDVLWNYASESLDLEQQPAQRFRELIGEIFVAGSDLSQNIGSISSKNLFQTTVYRFINWQFKRNINPLLRVKLGCGEAAQRQAGYYHPLAGKNFSSLQKLEENSPLRFGKYPLLGLARMDHLITLQSNAAEHVFRFIPLARRGDLFYHLGAKQAAFSRQASRILEMAQHTRLPLKERVDKELLRLSGTVKDPLYLDFLKAHKESYRKIVYGSANDLLGIHVISYFISRMVPALRDRPAVRPSREDTHNSREIAGKLAQTIPMAHHGSMLRAIGHSRAQSVVLGVNQLTTGLFLALHRVISAHKSTLQKDQILQRILQHLPVYDILRTLHLYQDEALRYCDPFKGQFGSGHGAYAALYQDVKLSHSYIPHLQNQLLLDCGITQPVTDTSALPPGLTLLLQKDIFNPQQGESVNADPSVDVDDRQTIAEWRNEIWKLIGEKVKGQVASFIELARAVAVISESGSLPALLGDAADKTPRLAEEIKQFVQKDADDPMRQFLFNTATLLSKASQYNIQLPVDALRALRDVRRIAQIDQQLLSGKEQQQLRFYLLQIARTGGDNG